MMYQPCFYWTCIALGVQSCERFTLPTPYQQEGGNDIELQYLFGIAAAPDAPNRLPAPYTVTWAAAGAPAFPPQLPAPPIAFFPPPSRSLKEPARQSSSCPAAPQRSRSPTSPFLGPALADILMAQQRPPAPQHPPPQHLDQRQRPPAPQHPPPLHQRQIPKQETWIPAEDVAAAPWTGMRGLDEHATGFTLPLSEPRSAVPPLTAGGGTSRRLGFLRPSPMALPPEDPTLPATILHMGRLRRGTPQMTLLLPIPAAVPLLPAAVLPLPAAVPPLPAAVSPLPAAVPLLPAAVPPPPLPGNSRMDAVRPPLPGISRMQRLRPQPHLILPPADDPALLPTGRSAGLYHMGLRPFNASPSYGHVPAADLFTLPALPAAGSGGARFPYADTAMGPLDLPPLLLSDDDRRAAPVAAGSAIQPGGWLSGNMLLDGRFTADAVVPPGEWMGGCEPIAGSAVLPGGWLSGGGPIAQSVLGGSEPDAWLPGASSGMLGRRWLSGGGPISQSVGPRPRPMHHPHFLNQQRPQQQSQQSRQQPLGPHFPPYQLQQPQQQWQPKHRRMCQEELPEPSAEVLPHDGRAEVLPPNAVAAAALPPAGVAVAAPPPAEVLPHAKAELLPPAGAASAANLPPSAVASVLKRSGRHFSLEAAASGDLSLGKRGSLEGSSSGSSGCDAAATR